MKNGKIRVMRKTALPILLMVLLGAFTMIGSAPRAFASSGDECNFNGDVGACIGISGNTIHSYAWLNNGGYAGCSGYIALYQEDPFDPSGWQLVQSEYYNCPSGHEHGDMYYPAISGYEYYVYTSSGQAASSPLLVALSEVHGTER